MQLRLVAIVALAGILAVQANGIAFAGPQKSPFDENGSLDVVKVEVRQMTGSNWVATVSLQNDENLAAMTLPFIWRPQLGHFRLDSASYTGLRTEYFTLKTFYPDTIAGTILIGLISNLGTDRPPLEPGNGPIARLHFTALNEQPLSLTVDTTFIRPFNVLQLVTPDVRSILPAFETHTAGPSDIMKPGPGAPPKSPDGR
jgi:hypothetical protein